MLLNNYHFTTLSIILYTCAYNLFLSTMAIQGFQTKPAPVTRYLKLQHWVFFVTKSINMQFCFTNLLVIIIWSFSEAYRFSKYCTSGEYPIPPIRRGVTHSDTLPHTATFYSNRKVLCLLYNFFLLCFISIRKPCIFTACLGSSYMKFILLQLAAT